MREIIFDTETTGLDPKSGDRLVEIGCIELVNRVETGRIFHCYFNPDRDMPAAAEAVHGLSATFLSDKPHFATEAEKLLTFLADSPLVAHNANFDFNFLNAELKKCGQETIPSSRMVDTLALARVRHPGAKLSLDALCSRYGIDRSHRTKHGALLDAELLTQLYIELTGGRQIGLELARVTSAVASEVSGAVAPITHNRQFHEPRPHVPTPEEIIAHTAFIEGISNPLWANTTSR